MTELQAIHTSEAPAAIGPYSQGVSAGGFFFSAGQVGLKPDTGDLAGTGVEEQTRQVFRNLRAVLGAAGLGLSDVVKSTVFLVDLEEFEVVNGIYAEHFGRPYPARSTVQAARLPKDARVEIEVVARLRP
jgi:2-iminobutanoate/2-iminopropanoate deaminase